MGQGKVFRRHTLKWVHSGSHQLHLIRSLWCIFRDLGLSTSRTCFWVMNENVNTSVSSAYRKHPQGFNNNKSFHHASLTNGERLSRSMHTLFVFCKNVFFISFLHRFFQYSHQWDFSSYVRPARYWFSRVYLHYLQANASPTRFISSEYLPFQRHAPNMPPTARSLKETCSLVCYWTSPGIFLTWRKQQRCPKVRSPFSYFITCFGIFYYSSILRNKLLLNAIAENTWAWNVLALAATKRELRCFISFRDKIGT